MFINLNKDQIIQLEKSHKAIFISLWDNTENASNFYSKKQGIYAAYTETKDKLDHAFSTPIKVYKIYSNAL